MMIRNIPILVAVLLIALASGCSSVKVSQDYDQAFNFVESKSYNWFEETQDQQEGLQTDNELLANRFRASIDQQLAKQGFTISESPSYLLAYNFTVTTRLQSEPVTTRVGYGYGRYDRYGGVGVSTGTSIRQYDLGTLKISIYDAESKRLVWNGIGTRETYTHYDPEEITKNVDEMVAAVLVQFPPGR